MREIKMSNEAILKKAIEKAVRNDYSRFAQKDVEFKDDNIDAIVRLLIKNEGDCFIFSHDFAKAFWGEQELSSSGEAIEKALAGYSDSWKREMRRRIIRIPTWKYHLQQMVLEENPIDYLEKFL